MLLFPFSTIYIEVNNNNKNSGGIWQNVQRHREAITLRVVRPIVQHAAAEHDPTVLWNMLPLSNLVHFPYSVRLSPQSRNISSQEIIELMKIRLYVLFAVLACAMSSTPYAFPIGGNDWRLLDETLGLSYRNVASVCDVNTGICSGTVGGVAMDGWIWASVSDINNMIFEVTRISTFDTDLPASEYIYGSLEMSTKFITEAAILLGIPENDNLFNATIESISGSNYFYGIKGLSRSGFLIDRTNLADIDNNYVASISMSLDQGNKSVVLSTASHQSKSSGGNNSTAVWMYRTTVAEPSTLVLLGLGLVGLWFSRRKNVTLE